MENFNRPEDVYRHHYTLEQKAEMAAFEEFYSNNKEDVISIVDLEEVCDIIPLLTTDDLQILMSVIEGVISARQGEPR